MDTDLIRRFSKAEMEHLREKARNANIAIGLHTEFVEFLRVQHDAPEHDGWLLGAMGFELQRENKTPSPVLSEGVNGMVAEEVERFN